MRTSLLFYCHIEFGRNDERGRGSRCNLKGRGKERDNGALERCHLIQVDIRS